MILYIMYLWCLCQEVSAYVDFLVCAIRPGVRSHNCRCNLVALFNMSVYWSITYYLYVLSFLVAKASLQPTSSLPRTSQPPHILCDSIRLSPLKHGTASPCLLHLSKVFEYTGCPIIFA